MRGTIQTAVLIITVAFVQLSLFLFSIPQSAFLLAYPIINNPESVLLSIYAHAGFGHLVSNLIALLVLGLIVERVTSTIRFHIFFVISGIIAGISQVSLSYLYTGEQTAVLGASGAIFALMGYAIIGNDLTESIIGFLDLGRAGTIALIVGLGALVTYMTAAPGVALIAHASGFIFGAACGKLRLLHIDSDPDLNEDEYVYKPDMQTQRDDKL